MAKNIKYIPSETARLIESKIPDVLSFYQQFHGLMPVLEKNIRCPFHDDHTPSFRIYRDGRARCFGECNIEFSGMVDFYRYYHRIDINEAEQQLLEKYVDDRFRIYREAKDLARKRLEEHPEIADKICSHRGWKKEVFDKLEIGITDKLDRLTIPIFNKDGAVWVNIIYNVWKHEGYPREYFEKDLPKKRICRIWPISIIHDNPTLFVVEGRTDVFMLLSNDIPAVTLGASSYKFRADDISLLKGKEIYVCYDADEAGKNGQKNVASQLFRSGHPKKIKTIELCFDKKKTKNDKDVSDYIRLYGVEKFKGLIRNAKDFSLPKAKMVQTNNILLKEEERSSAPFVQLHEFCKSERYNKYCQFEATITGKSTTPKFAPRILTVHCKRRTRKCIAENTPCKINPGNAFGLDMELQPEDSYTIALMREKRIYFHKFIKQHLGLSAGCQIDVQVKESFSVREVLLSPVVPYQATHSSSSEVMHIPGYIFDDDVKISMPYLMTGFPLENPSGGGTAIAIITGVKKLSSAAEDFTLTPEIYDQLSTFQYSPGSTWVKGGLWEYLMDYYDNVSKSITRIYGRPLLHIAADLVFFGPLSFIFDGEFIQKGTIEALILGDTRCGKNGVAENLLNYYEAGEVINAENATYMGLVGGIEIVEGFSGIGWGRFVVRSRETVIVDETSAMSLDFLGRLSRVRHHGIASVEKKYKSTALALCGKIWLSNPRQGKMSDYRYGVEALINLMGGDKDKGPADISRFTYVHIVQMDEVPLKIINMIHKEKERPRYTRKEHHNLITWIKSRKPEQIIFQEDATEAILDHSLKLASVYDARYVPLIQGEDIRNKLAKIAAAVAGRVFSTDSKGENLIIMKSHVLVAVRLLNEMYKKPANGYLALSNYVRKTSKIDEHKIEEQINKLSIKSGLSKLDIYKSFFVQETFSRNDFLDNYNLATYDLTELLNVFRQGAMRKDGKYNMWVKTKDFRDLCKRKINELMVEYENNNDI